ncbi:MAG: mechanosensitive ion channel domain-containing protein [Bacteroidota bacterium]
MQEFINNNWGHIEHISFFLIVLLLTFLIAYPVNRFLGRLIKHSSSKMAFDPTNYNFIRHSIVALIYIVGIAIAISQVPELRKFTNSLLAGAGILALAVGFASQHALGNVVSGFFIVLFKPFRINDRISLQNKNFSGTIEDITLRHVVIRDFENRRVIVPNTLISNEVIVNADFAELKICRWIDVHIARSANLELAKRIMLEETLKHPLRIDNRTEEEKEKGNIEVPVRVLALNEAAVHVRAWAWAANQADAFALGCDLLESIYQRFEVEGVAAPYPHRVLITGTDKNFTAQT